MQYLKSVIMNGMIFGGRCQVLDMRCVFCLSLQLLYETFCYKFFFKLLNTQTIKPDNHKFTTVAQKVLQHNFYCQEFII